jgi:uncharacterized protein DUF2550
MPWWAEILDVLGVLAAVGVAVFVFFFARRRVLSRRGGTFECSLRMRKPRKSSPAGSRGWELGLGRYDGERLEWFRVFSFRPRPKAVFDRPIEVLSRRKPHGAESFSLYAGHIVVSVRLGSGQVIEMAMSEQALTAFMAWTEAAPPGQERLLG